MTASVGEVALRGRGKEGWCLVYCLPGICTFIPAGLDGVYEEAEGVCDANHSKYSAGLPFACLEHSSAAGLQLGAPVPSLFLVNLCCLLNNDNFEEVSDIFEGTGIYLRGKL